MPSIEVDLSYPASDVGLRPTPYGLVVTLDGVAGGGEPGDPAVPRSVVRVALPEGASATEIAATALSTKDLSAAPVLLAPVQPLRACATNPPTHPPTHPPMHSPAPTAGPGPGAGPESRASLRRGHLAPLAEPVAPTRMALPNPARYAQFRPRPLATLLESGDPEVPVTTIEVNPLALDADGRLILHERVRVTVAYRIQRLDGRRRFRDQRQTVEHLAMMRQLVVNPEILAVDQGRTPADPLSAEYLVITDRRRWDAATITPGSAVDGDPVAEFSRLTAWKRARGLTARVVIISDIVDGRYGDFGAKPPPSPHDHRDRPVRPIGRDGDDHPDRRDSRDLQEVIRKFLKHARESWGTRWVLLGGDIDIVPIRVAAGGLRGDIAPTPENTPNNTPDNTPNNTPAPGQAHWTGSQLRMCTEGLAEWWAANAGNTLLRPDTGQIIPYDGAATAPLGWHFTDPAYATVSSIPTDHVVVNGTADQVNVALRWLYVWNRIPTDFYYASLVGSAYDRYHRHDWDVHGNGVYGEYGDDGAIAWQAHLSVGRAPIRDGADAAAFVDKVLAYEQLPQTSLWAGGQLYESDMLVAGDSWGGGITVNPISLATPGENQYVHRGGTSHAILRLPVGEVPITYQLFAQLSPDDLRLIPYDGSAGATRRGWYYATGPTDLTPSVVPLAAPWSPSTTVRIPLPTACVVVFSDLAAELAPQLYVLGEAAADGSMTNQERVAGIARSVLKGLSGIRRLYTDEVDLPVARRSGAQHLDRAALTAALNDGPHLVSLSGHGSPGGGVCGLDSTLAGSLSNGHPGFIGYADSCLTAAVDQDSMGERLLTNPAGGALAYVGNTRFSWVGAGDDFQRLFWQRLATTPHVGLLADSRCELLHTASAHPPVTKWSILSLNLLGDPELPIWSRRPRTLRVPVESRKVDR
jgi:hypothetical protein